jgi:putative DNA primase/helicase
MSDDDNITELAGARAKRSMAENDVANAFAAKYADHLRYVAKWAQWFAWENACWREDTTLHTYDRIRRFCETSKRKPKAQMVAAIERLAKSDRRLAATHDQWDTDPWLLNTPAGVVDLRNGAIRPARPEDYMTKITAVGPDPSCSTAVWIAFLDRITGSKPDLIAFHHRFFGYALTGVTREHAMAFGYGTGANGKSVETATVAGIMGDYHTTAPLDTFTASLQDHHPTDLAGLRGARLVTVTEIEEGRRWAEGKIKTMTGGDRISARFMRQDFFEYVPQFKLWVAGNHKPRLRNVDEAMRRRLHLVPFSVTIPPEERDLELAEKLKAEWPGILHWMISGCLEWQQQGLAPPSIVSNATSEYFEAEDAIGLWLEDRIERRSGAFALCNALYSSWKDWIEARGEEPGSQKQLTETLQGKHFKFVRRNNGRGFEGIAFAVPRDQQAADEAF